MARMCNFNTVDTGSILLLASKLYDLLLGISDLFYSSEIILSLFLLSCRFVFDFIQTWSLFSPSVALLCIKHYPFSLTL